jgi:hypothetical protein
MMLLLGNRFMIGLLVGGKGGSPKFGCHHPPPHQLRSPLQHTPSYCCESVAEAPTLLSLTTLRQRICSPRSCSLSSISALVGLGINAINTAITST